MGDEVMSSNPLDWIEEKKRGGRHSRETIDAIVRAVTHDAVPDYQVSAWLMAVWHRGLDPEEMLWLTESMRDSGTVLQHAAAREPTADKHSTGGVGDKASLVIAPLAAELGLCVPMLSGRGLGHTGGTLDKLQSIPGYRADLTPDEFEEVLGRVGCSIIGQTADMAPADRRLYALRDVTGTVDCSGLIVASILSKKLAAGPSNLVIDLKCGTGAFMPDLEAAHELAGALVATGRAAGLKASALVTDMNQPLGCSIGHAIEVREALDCLRGAGPADLRELCVELTAEMARLAGLGELCGLRDRCRALLDDGSAERRFVEMVMAHGGREDFEQGLVVAEESAAVQAEREGVIRLIDAAELGRSLIELGGGRREHSDPIDLSVGLRWLVRIGDVVEAGQPLCSIHCADADRVAAARARIEAAVAIDDDAVGVRPVVLDRSPA
jgi:pyrimidine-nucleoside phosphorylase